MNKNFELKYLSEVFLIKFPEANYPKFENKLTRPYVVFLVRIDNHTFAIPFRTNMNHKYGYKFLKSGRESNASTGLDFTKAVLVDDEKLLGDDAIIDNDEFLELNKKHFFIRKKFERYYDGYKKYLNGELNEFQSRAYQYTTLKYFKNKLNIN